MTLINEPEILDAARAWPEAQEALRGSTAGRTPLLRVMTTWYGTSVHPLEGAFALVDPAGAYAHLKGDVLEVRYRRKSIFVYCIASAGLPYEFAITRKAYFELTRDLADDEIAVRLTVV